MRSKALLLIGAATVCGMIASIGLSQLTGKPAAKSARASVRQRIYVAQYDISPGELLGEDNLRLESWEVDSVPPDALVRLEEALGKVCQDSLKRGEPIQVNALKAPSHTMPTSFAIAAPDPQSPAPSAPVNSMPVPPTPIAQTPAPQTAILAPSSVPAITSMAKPVEAVTKSAEAAATPAGQAEAIGLSPPAVSGTNSPDDQVAPKSSDASIAGKQPAALAELREATPRTPRTRLAAPANVSASGVISDEGWVMTVYKSKGTKVLRWRPTADSSAVQPRVDAVEQSARPTSDPKKG